MKQELQAVADAIDKRFESIIGQTEAKEQVRDILLSGAADGFITPMLIIAPPGFGKSHFLKAIRDLLKGVLNRKTLLAWSGSNLGTKAEFFEELVIPKFHGQASVIIADEAHEATKGVLASMRSLLEPTAERSARTIQYNDSDVTFDPFLNSIVLATNKIDLLDPALVSRFEKIYLTFFKEDEMATILHDAVVPDGAEWADGSLMRLANCNRGNARDVIHWVNAVRRRMLISGSKVIDKAASLAIIRSRKSYPEGVNAMELSTLIHLEKRGALQLKELASMNQCSSDEQNTNEGYLRQKGFIGIDGKRHITGDGREFLAMLRKEGFIEEIKEKSLQD